MTPEQAVARGQTKAYSLIPHSEGLPETAGQPCGVLTLVSCELFSGEQPCFKGVEMWAAP